MPNILGLLLYTNHNDLSNAFEGFLNFLGLGIQPQWVAGNSYQNGVESMEEYGWLLIYPGITFTITLFIKFFGDGLRML